MRVDMGGFLTLNLLIVVVGLVILYRGYCRRYVSYKERQALIDFFDRLERKGINPREFILPPPRRYTYRMRMGG